MNSPNIPEGLQEFLSHAESLHPLGNPKRENGFAKEFQQLKALSSQLKRNPEYHSHHGEMECNRPKNQYKDIVPFDYNRVILPTLPGMPGSDYINGNYIKGADGNAAYLALQGPLPRTVDDFWRLIVSHKCQVVIMVCKEIEMGKLKCKRYWPESKDEKLSFAGLNISLISEDNVADGFVIRTIKMKSGKEEMIVTQLQYTAWPDHDVPKSATPLIEMNKTLRALQGNGNQQILIHCSAGCGRTGTICAVDYAWTLLKMQKTDNFSVYDIVANLRRQRMAMVQTKEQYALVYKAVVQLVHEELEKEKFKFHTYVNVELPRSPQSSSGESTYENCEFIKSVGRWKQSDLQNGSVPKRPLSLPLPAAVKTKPDPKPSVSHRAPIPPPSTEGMVPTSNAKASKDYVNLEFGNSNDLGMKVAPGMPENKPATSVKTTPPHKDFSQPILNSNAVKSGVQTPSAGRQKSPTIADYEVLPGASSSPPMLNTGNSTAMQRNKGLLSDYEIPPLAAQGGKKQEQTRHVPEGLLIDLGDDVPPLPTKRHSVGSSRSYENIEVLPPCPPGISSQRAYSSPNVLDDMFMLTDSASQPQVTQHQKNNSDSRGFYTVPNRQKPNSEPKRCLLTKETFEDPRTSVGGGFNVLHSPTEASGQYSLVGALTNPSPPKVTPVLAPHPNPGTGLQMPKGHNSSPPKVTPVLAPHPNPSTGLQMPKGHNSSPPKVTPVLAPHPNPCTGPQMQMLSEKGYNSSPPKKQGEKPKARAPVGAYSLVGIPETVSQMTVLVESVPTKAKSNLTKENTGSPVEVKNTGIPMEVKNTGWPLEVKNAGNPVEVKNTASPVQVKNAGIPAEVKNSGLPAEPSYELVGQRVQPAKKVSPPAVLAYKPKADVEANEGTKATTHGTARFSPNVDKEKPAVESDGIPEIYLRGQGDGQAISEVLVGTDVYATVSSRPNDHRETKGSNIPNLSAKSVGSSPKLRNQASSGSLKSYTSTSSEEGEAPPVPQKTNEAFLAPGEEPYENVQQSNKGTLDRFKKMMKTGAKGSSQKRISDVTLPHGLQRSNSSGSGVTVRLDDIGYKKHVCHPKGPRSCPKHWPSCSQFGL